MWASINLRGKFLGIGARMTKSILVTGASKGIGRATALQLARDGFDIAVHYAQDEAAAAETLAAIRNEGGDGHCVSFDISNRAQCLDVLEAEMSEHGVYYGVVLNAGISKDNAFPSLEGDDWDLVLRTNLDGFYNVLHPLTMPMIQAKRGGRIVTISSISGEIGNRGQVNYSAAKAGIIGATKSLALELAKRKITVNCVAPGLIETQMTENLPLDDLKKMIPMRRIGTPADVAATVSFLCSNGAAYITRQVISVNGGMI